MKMELKKKSVEREPEPDWDAIPDDEVIIHLAPRATAIAKVSETFEAEYSESYHKELDEALDRLALIHLSERLGYEVVD